MDVVIERRLFLEMYRCCCSVTESCLTLCDQWTAALQASLSFTTSWSLLKLTSIESVMPSNHLMLCHPLLILPSIFPNIRVFSSELALHIRWPKYWSFSFSISHSDEFWFPLGLTDCSPCSPRDSQESSPIPQFKSISSSALSLLDGPALTTVHVTGKTIALTIWIFVCKVIFALIHCLGLS